MISSVFTEGPSNSVYIGVSTKMYLGYQASLRWLEQVREVVDARPTLMADGPVQLFVMPSFPLLESARRILAGSPVRLGAQNCSWGDGPLTGEVSAGMLVELGVSLVEVGHAERRLLFGEDGAVVARKLSAVRKAGITALLCLGEHRRGAPDDAALFCATPKQGDEFQKHESAGQRAAAAPRPTAMSGALGSGRHRSGRTRTGNGLSAIDRCHPRAAAAQWRWRR